MSCNTSTQRLSWLQPSAVVLNVVRDALVSERKALEENAKAHGLPAVPQGDEIDALIASEPSLREFVARAVLSAIGVVMLRSQTDQPLEIQVGSAGRFSPDVESALATELPADALGHPIFFAKVYEDVLESARKCGGHIDLGRGALIVDLDAVRIKLKALEPTPPISRVTARVDTAPTP